MRRWIALFLLCLVTLQSTWAAAASYCGHEAAPDSAHFGHHAHAHAYGDEASAVPTGAVDVADGESTLMPHLDCPACQACCAAMLPARAQLAATTGVAPRPAERQQHLPAPPPAAVERPDWHTPA